MDVSSTIPCDTAAIGLVAKNSVDYVRRFFDALARGVVVVPLRSKNDSQRIRACGLANIVEPADGGGWFRCQFEPSTTDSLAQVAFTSGTEGEPKGVMLTHRNLADAVIRIRQVMGLDATVREYVGVPVYLAFGFGRCRTVSASGGSFYIPPGGFDLRELATMLDAGEVNSICAVPTLWRLVLRNRELFAASGAHVRWIEIGSQAMTRDEKLAMRALFPRACIVQHYGLTEASRSTFLDVRAADDDALDSVGGPVGATEIGITPEGRIKIRGPHVARELLLGGKRVPNVDPEGWFITNDLGEWRDGRLYFRGRFDDVINIGGIKVSPDRLEDDVRAALRIDTGFCIARVADPMRGEAVLVAAVRSLSTPDHKLRAATTAGLSALGIDASSAVTVTRVDALPTTDSGKIQRNVVAARYLQVLADARGDQPEFEAPTVSDVGASAHVQGEGVVSRFRRTRASSVREIYQSLFPAQKIGDSDTFATLGGDSLSYVEATLAIEELLGELPPDWQNMSVIAFGPAASPKSSMVKVDTSVLLRCLGIIAIVSWHFNLLEVGGATFLLIAVAGFNFARFQLPNVLEKDTVWPMFASVLHIAVPTALAMGLHQLKTGDFDLLELALTGNWETAKTDRFTFWFLDLLIQLYLVVALLLAVPTVRQKARRSPLLLPLTLLVMAVAVAKISPLFWDIEDLAFRVPHVLIWLFFLGWVLQRAQTSGERSVVAIAVPALPFFLWGTPTSDTWWLQYGEVWVVAGCLMLLFVQGVKLPRFAYRGISSVADASMFIYIMHWTAQTYWHRIGMSHQPLVDVCVGIAAGIVASWIWKSTLRRIQLVWSSRTGQQHVTGGSAL